MNWILRSSIDGNEGTMTGACVSVTPKTPLIPHKWCSSSYLFDNFLQYGRLSLVISAIRLNFTRLSRAAKTSFFQPIDLWHYFWHICVVDWGYTSFGISKAIDYGITIVTYPSIKYATGIRDCTSSSCFVSAFVAILFGRLEHSK